MPNLINYPPNWPHATIHINPETAEIHIDGDQRVKEWVDKLGNKIVWQANQLLKIKRILLEKEEDAD